MNSAGQTDAQAMPGAPGPAVPASMWAIAVLFFLKASVLALFVTPLWDVPDELAHFATISDLASGRGVPRPGSAVVPPEAVRLWNPSLAARPVYNWTAVHPPGYHVLAVPFLWGATALTADPSWQVRGTRLFSALCGAVGLLFFFRVLREAGADRASSLAAAAAVGCLPMYSHMSSGVSHDILCAVAGGVVALFWMRLLRSGAIGDAVGVGLTLAAAGSVKATAVPVAFALLLQLPVHLPGRLPGRLARAAAVSLLAFSTTVAWALWRGKVPDSDVRPAVGPVRPTTPLALFDVMREAPVLDHTFKNFFGLIGWTGTGKGSLDWIQVSGPFLATYLLLAAALLALTAAWIWRGDFGAAKSPGEDRAAAASWFVGALVLAATFGWLVSRPSTAWPKLLLYSLLLSLLSLSALRVWRRRPAPAGAVFSSQFTALVFALAYLFHIARNALASGGMHGTHGRYFFVVLGFLLVGLALPACARLAAPARPWLLTGVVLTLCANEAAFFALRVAPFYRGAAAAWRP